MKFVKLSRTKEISLIDVPEPRINHRDDVKIRVRYGAINPDDYSMVTNTLRSGYHDGGLGHEFSGEIVERGEDAAHVFSIGDMVSAIPFQFCGKCINCKSGRSNLCMETSALHSAFCEYIVLKDTQIIKLHNGISLQEGCLFWLAMTCAHCIHKLQIQPGQNILILGGGSAGLMLLQMAKLRGAVLTVISEPVSRKRELARTLGASYAINPRSENIFEVANLLTDGRGFDIVIDACGDFSALNGISSVLARGATLMLFSMYDAGKEFAFSLSEQYYLEYSIQSSFGASNAHYMGYSANIMSQLNLEPLIGIEFPIEHIAEAIAAFASRQHMRVLIRL